MRQTKARRLGTAFASGLAALALLAGCASTEIPKLGGSETTTAQVTTAAVTVVTTAAETTSVTAPPVTQAPETTTTPVTTAPVTTTADPVLAVYSAAKHVKGLRLDPTDTDGIYEIKDLPEDNPDIEYHNGVALAFTYSRKKKKKKSAEINYTIRAYDLRQGLLLGESDTKTTGYSCYSPDTCGAYDGGFYSCVGNKVRLLDVGLNVTDEFTLPVAECSRLWMSPGGKYILCNEKRGPSRLFDVEKRCEAEMSVRVKAASVIASSADSFDIVNTKSERFRVMGSGSVMRYGKLSFSDIYLDVMNDLDGTIIDLAPAGLFIRKPHLSTIRLIKYPPSNIHYILSLDDRYVAFADENDKTRIFDLETGMLSEEIGSGVYAARGKDKDGSFVFLDNENWEGKTRYLLTVPSEVKYESEPETAELDLKTEEYKLYFEPAEPDSEKSSALLSELLKKNNVRVVFEPVSEDEQYCGYYCKTYRGSQAEILESLRDFLAQSPPELLTEATDTGEETWILVSSEIVDDYDLTSYGTAAFATRIGLHPFAALETPMTEEQAKEADYFTEKEKNKYSAKFITDNFSHEFIHLLDEKTSPLQADEWLALSPEDAYFGGYDSGSRTDEDKYVKFSKEFDNSVYFTDSYGRVNDLEDKARIGENLYYARTGEVHSKRERFARSESLYNKARALCELFRENYPCLASIPGGEWYLEKPLMGSYAEMKAQWKADKKKEEE